MVHGARARQADRMLMHRLGRSLIVAGLTAIAAPSVAAAESSATRELLRACADGTAIEASYTPEELSTAIEQLPADVAEYTDCGDQLAAARRRALATPRAPTLPTSRNPGGSVSLGRLVAARGAATQPTTPTEPAGGSPTTPGNEAVGFPVPSPAAATTNDAAGPAAEHATAAPVAGKLGSLVAAGIVGASLLGLWRPAMLRRHEADGE
jgi:hypothetical protein